MNRFTISVISTAAPPTAFSIDADFEDAFIAEVVGTTAAASEGLLTTAGLFTAGTFVLAGEFGCCDSKALRGNKTNSSSDTV